MKISWREKEIGIKKYNKWLRHPSSEVVIRGHRWRQQHAVLERKGHHQKPTSLNVNHVPEANRVKAPPPRKIISILYWNWGRETNKNWTNQTAAVTNKHLMSHSNSFNFLYVLNVLFKCTNVFSIFYISFKCTFEYKTVFRFSTLFHV